MRFLSNNPQSSKEKKTLQNMEKSIYYVENESIIDKDLKTTVTGPIKKADRRNRDKLASDYLKITH